MRDRTEVGKDWVAWHRGYDEPGSYLPRRLAVVQARLRAALAGAPAGPVRIVSACAGEGRDVLGVLADHPRRDDVAARLVDLDPANSAAARAAAAAAGLDGVEVVEADAGITDVYTGAVPADVVLLCGVFGNVPDEDIERTVRAAPMLCAPGATVLWTRHRLPPDRTPTIRRWFAEAGFVEQGFDTNGTFSVGTTRLAAEPRPLEPALRLFEFS